LDGVFVGLPHQNTVSFSVIDHTAVMVAGLHFDRVWS